MDGDVNGVDAEDGSADPRGHVAFSERAFYNRVLDLGTLGGRWQRAKLREIAVKRKTRWFPGSVLCLSRDLLLAKSPGPELSQTTDRNGVTVVRFSEFVLRAEASAPKSFGAPLRV